MVDIQSKEVIDKISDDLKIQPSIEIPRELAKQIQLVYNVNPVKISRVFAGTTSDATTSDIFDVSTTKRTFVTSIMLSVTKDVLATSVISTVNIEPINSQIQNSNLIRYEPLIAGSFLNTVNFQNPIELKKGSVISVTNSTAVGSIDSSAVIVIYETDPQ